MTRVEILEQARAIITKPGSWIQGTYARDAQDNIVVAENPAACKWCMSGAIDKIVCDNYNIREYQIQAYWNIIDFLTHKASSAFDNNGVIAFNDTESRTHKDILSAFDKAIKIAKIEEGESE